METLIKIVKTTEPSIKISTLAIGSIVCFIYNVIADPDGAINQFMIFLIDMVYSLFPSTPTQYTIGSMLSSFAAEHPAIGWGSVYEIFSGMSVMFGLWCIVKLWQLLPFT